MGADTGADNRREGAKLAPTLAVPGDRLTLRLVAAPPTGPQRFSELPRAVPGSSAAGTAPCATRW